MQAIILAGGRGSRLRPITDYVPKPLTDLSNTPLLEWQIRYLQKFGITDIVVCSGYKTEMIEHFVKWHGWNNVTISREHSPLGTGGAIKNASSVIYGEKFLVMNGDIITDIDVTKIPTDGIAAVPLRTKFGILSLDDDYISSFNEKVAVQDRWINAGIYILSRDALDQLPAIGNIEDTLFPQWARSRRLKAAKFVNAQWYSIDSFKDITDCSAVISSIV